MNSGGVVDENYDEGHEVISDLTYMVITENQIYKDKKTLMEVMRHYEVVQKFQFLMSRSNTVYTPKDIAKDMLKLHDVSLTYMQAWRVKEKALKLLRGDLTESYAKLRGYLYILEQIYPGSVLSLKRKEGESLLYAFVALKACIRGWEYCWPVVVVDGAALRGAYGGTMLTASTMDP
ncbi:hypothetical protein KY290_000957 [Solanum tuberosum]|uniref:Uncharacterized protein n=1 Tax=Solanum tuberosum TaxID=4113 RepID=A0ABQ7WKS3_SOLTU|nr:hypothetical protein KY290_000957 [Solanum tuberosum]